MKKGKLIVIAGTDCSGKETQTRNLINRLKSEGVGCDTMSFPRYDTPTGKIIGGCYLGKEEICNCWFPDGSDSVGPKVASLYYAADRRAALPEIEKILSSGKHLILDRYVSANMGHQGGKIRDSDKRKEFYNFEDSLEYELLGLPRPDMTIFLYMPLDVAMELKKGRSGAADGHESNPEHLKNAEEAYLQLAKIYDWVTIDCVYEKSGALKTREKIHNEIWENFSEIFLKSKF